MDYFRTRSALPIILCFVSLSSCSDRPYAVTSTESSDVCTVLNQKIDDAIKSYALSLAQGVVADNNAIQQSARYIQNGNRLLSVQANLTLMGQNGCKPRSNPITPDDYSASASACYKDTLNVMFNNSRGKTASQPEPTIKSCDYSKWKTDDD
jgi:hypothetical protein